MCGDITGCKSLAFLSSSSLVFSFSIRLVSRGSFESALSASGGEEQKRGSKRVRGGLQGERERREKGRRNHSLRRANGVASLDRGPCISLGGPASEQCAIPLSAACWFATTIGVHGGERRRNKATRCFCVPVFFLRKVDAEGAEK